MTRLVAECLSRIIKFKYRYANAKNYLAMDMSKWQHSCTDYLHNLALITANIMSASPATAIYIYAPSHSLTILDPHEFSL